MLGKTRNGRIITIERSKLSYHTLPCGTRIPDGGLKAWVRFKNCVWHERTIVACIEGKAVAAGDAIVLVVSYDEYSLVPPAPEKKRIQAIKLAGKWLRGEYTASLVISMHPDYVCTVHEQISTDDLVKDSSCHGWSDTADSEIKEFWVT